MPKIRLSSELHNSIIDQEPASGYTHTFYKYPARFSPNFVRSAISQFSEIGDLVLDPFMGGGTTLVEAVAQGRNALGTDISPLSQFISRVKTDIPTKREMHVIADWAADLPNPLGLHNASSHVHKVWSDEGYQKDIPWHLRKAIELLIDEITTLPTSRAQRLARCALLKTGQWALDCTSSFPSSEAFRLKFTEIIAEHLSGMGQLDMAVNQVARAGNKPRALCLNKSAEQLTLREIRQQFKTKPTLVVTSPPYPAVHVLYHRWQVNGRKETAAPFWIIGERDGNGEAFYTMGGRSNIGLENYFSNLERSFAAIRGVLAPGGHIVQLVSFSDNAEQMPRYLDTMRRVGFKEILVETEVHGSGRVWRPVPSRKWYASVQQSLDSSKELFLVHTAK